MPITFKMSHVKSTQKNLIIPAFKKHFLCPVTIFIECIQHKIRNLLVKVVFTHTKECEILLKRGPVFITKKMPVGIIAIFQR